MIDLMSNKTMTTHQIDKLVVKMIRQKYPVPAETKLTRISIGQLQGKRPFKAGEEDTLNAYQVYVEQMAAIGEQAYLDNDLLKRTLAYEKATQRLTRFLLENGTPDTIIDPVLNELGEVIEEGYTIIGITPIVLMVDVPIYDEEGLQTGTESILNPIIEKDRNERTIAQTTIDNSLQDVVDLAVLRGSK